MTRSENMMSRWSRMKQQSARRPAPDDLSSETKPTDAEAGDLNRATAATPAKEPPASPVFDPASLPLLQSITAGTDIRSFLASNVPLELTKAALRRAWVTDPAIRDFIGIAENQWDFNDPTAMPGFEPLRAGDVPGLAGLGETEQTSDVTTDAVGAERPSPTPQIDETDHARAREYSLLAALLSRSPDAQMIEHLVRLSGDATQLGAAHAALSAAAASINPEQIEREYFDLFVGLGRGELFPYASYYLTGYLYGRPLARVRETLKQLGLERTEDNRSPRITLRSFSKSWPASPAARSLLPAKASAISSRPISSRGSGVSFRISSTPSLRNFMPASEPSAAFLRKSKLRDFQFRHDFL
jgi:hypothetical protein